MGPLCSKHGSLSPVEKQKVTDRLLDSGLNFTVISDLAVLSDLPSNLSVLHAW